MNEIFRFRRLSTDPTGTIHGVYESTGVRPRFVQDLETQNLALSPELFSVNRPLE
jgi:pilus assembly protein CpaF